MGMPIILGWPVSILGSSSSREEWWRRLTQFSSSRVFLIPDRNDWQQQFHLVLIITQPERKAPALLFPLHYVDSWGFSDVACRGRPWEVWQNSLRKWWLQKEKAHLLILGLVPDNSWSIWCMVLAVEEWLEFSQAHFWEDDLKSEYLNQCWVFIATWCGLYQWDFTCKSNLMCR